MSKTWFIYANLFHMKHLCTYNDKDPPWIDKSIRHLIQENNEACKRLWCFPVNSCEFLRTPFFTEHLRWLVLKVVILLFVSTETSKPRYYCHLSKNYVIHPLVLKHFNLYLNLSRIVKHFPTPYL